MGLEPAELARWTRFAAKGGIGKGTAKCDCVAESPDDLMFMKDDEIIVLLQLPDKEGHYLGYCEGVVGQFSGAHVVFHSKLKKPVMAKRASTNATLSVVQSILNLPNTPSPTTPRTPINWECNNPSRPSSRRTTGIDDTLLLSGENGQDSSASSLGGQSNSTMSSPTSGSWHNYGSQDVQRHGGGLQYGPASQREFHHSLAPDEGKAEKGFSRTVDSQGASSFSTNTPSSARSSTPSPVSFCMSQHLSTPPKKRQERAPSLNLPDSPGSLVDEVATTTAPLRIKKRIPSNPSSPLPLYSTFSLPSATPTLQLSPDVSLASIVATEGADSNTPVATSTHEFLLDTVGTYRTPTDPSFLVDPTSSSASLSSFQLTDAPAYKADDENETTPPPVLPLDLDSFGAADTTHDDLVSNHPGRFSLFSMSSTSALLGMTGQVPRLSEGNEDEIGRQSLQDVSPPRSAGRAVLSVAALGKVDEATLASTQAQVGIGLSLLQDLVGGMGSDSESGSDYDDSDNEAAAKAKAEIEAEEYSISLGKPVKCDRTSVAASEESTVAGLTYASGEEDLEPFQISSATDKGRGKSLSANPTLSPTSDDFDPALLSPATSPTVSRFPCPHSQQVHTHVSSSPHESNFSNSLERERRPSLAPSAMSAASGVSVRSGTSGSWDGDIYDNYRYSRFSMTSAAVVTGRPSVDSIRTPANSGDVNGRTRSESMGMALQPKGAIGQSEPMADAACLPPPPSFPLNSEELPKQTRESPGSPNFEMEDIAKTMSLLPVKDNDGDSTTGRSLRGMASAVRQRLETDRRSPLPQQGQNVEGDEESGGDKNNASLLSADFAQHIVVDDDELPPNILADGQDYEDGDTSLESNESEVESRLVSSPEPLNTTEEEQSRATESVDTQTSSSGLAAGHTVSLAIKNGEINGVSSTSHSQPVRSISPEYHQSPVQQPSREQLPGPQVPSHLRPRDTHSAPPESAGRRSLFMPHPNAPKAPAGASMNFNPGVGVGTMPQGQPCPTIEYRLASQPRHHPGHNSLPPQLRPTFQAVIRMAMSIPPRTMPPAPGRPPVRIWPTIYGRTDTDLSSSIGPVPITFSLDPPAAQGGGRATAPRGAALRPIGTGGTGGIINDRNQSASISQSSPPRQRVGMMSQPPSRNFSLLSSSNVPIVKPVISPETNTSLTSSSSDVQEKIVKADDDKLNTKPETLPNTTKQGISSNSSSALTPIPRNNFVPNAGVMRPRSRSFSGFNAPSSTVNGEKQNEPTNVSPKRSTSSFVPPKSVGTGSSRSGPTPKSPIKSSPLRPSPLSTVTVNSSVSSSSQVANGSLKSPTSPFMRGTAPPSPLGQSVFISPSSPTASVPSPRLLFGASNPKPSDVTPAQDSDPLAISGSRVVQPSSPTLVQQTSVSRKVSNSALIDGASTSTINTAGSDAGTVVSRVAVDSPHNPSSRSTSPPRNSLTTEHQERGTTSDLPTVRTVRSSTSPGPVAANGKSSMESINRQVKNVSGPGIVRQTSLRAKLSLPNLRRHRSREDDTIGLYDRNQLVANGIMEGELDAIQGRDRRKEMVQVQDTEFEFIRPNAVQLQSQQRTSEDSTPVRQEGSIESRADGGGLLRPESPAVSLNSSAPRSPIFENPVSTGLETGAPSLTQSTESMEAHRQRELKWVSLMSSASASLSRKSKKVKKLLVDGVPSSVRYLIWSFLTDGKGRAVKGVYEQLCKRGGVLRTRDIAADAERLFGMSRDGEVVNDGTRYLHATRGAAVVLLQAYFNMVPDVQYVTGLTKIVGQLLLLAPEEDAFWIFTSIMDTHLRPYFSVGLPSPSQNVGVRSTQMEVDAALYSRALEAIDPPVSKKIFVDLGIVPGIICQPWFTSLFVGALPPEYVNRIWDIFLYEGIPFLLRVALSLTILCRQFILASATNTELATLNILARPPPQWLPPTPELFLNSVMSVKLKDDDVRKQRVKMGEMVKRQTQAQQGPSGVGQSGISLPRV